MAPLTVFLPSSKEAEDFPRFPCPALDSNQPLRFFRPRQSPDLPTGHARILIPSRAMFAYRQNYRLTKSGPDGNRTRRVLIDSEVSPPGELRTKVGVAGGNRTLLFLIHRQTCRPLHHSHHKCSQLDSNQYSSLIRRVHYRCVMEAIHEKLISCRTSMKDQPSRWSP